MVIRCTKLCGGVGVDGKEASPTMAFCMRHTLHTHGVYLHGISIANIKGYGLLPIIV